MVRQRFLRGRLPGWSGKSPLWSEAASAAQRTGTTGTRLSWLYAFLFFELGVNLPFFPLWLQAQSLGADAIGIILAAPLLTRIAANPIVGALADRSGRISTALSICAVLVAMGTALLGIVASFWPILIAVIAIALAQGPLIALADAMTLGRLAEEPQSELTYGRIRLWGSIGFAVANLVAGWSLEWFAAPSIIVLLLLSAVLTAGAAIRCGGQAGRRPKVAASSGALRRPSLLLLGTVAGAALVQASHAAFYGFGTLHWRANGMSGAAMGGLWAVGVLSEVALFALLGYRMRGPASAAGLLVVAAAVTLLRWAGMAQDPGLATLVLLQLMHGLTFGATHLGSIFLLARLAPDGMQARAQAWLAAGWAGAMAGLTTVSGRLYESWGEQIYLVMFAVAAAGLALLFCVMIGLRRVPLRGPASLA